MINILINLRPLCFFLIFCFILLFNNPIKAQCPDVDAGDDQVECSVPGLFDLDGDVDGDCISVEWTPDIGISDPFSISTEAEVSSDCMTYTLTARVIDYDNNLVENGDFEAGFSDFYNDYILHDDATFADQLIEGEFTVDNDPSPLHVNWVACTDQVGGGNMLIANGSEIAGQSVWCQDINIDSDTEYVFSAWIASVDPNGPAELQFSIDGADIGGGSVVISNPCSWFQYFEFWDSGGNTSITICIEDLNTAEPGNDFAIDGIVFAPVCNSQDTVRLCVSEVDAFLTYNGPICSGETLEIEASGGEFYDWWAPFNISSNDCCLIYDNAEADYSGLYGVTVEDENGCQDYQEIEIFVFDSYEEVINSTTCDPSLAGDYIENLETEEGCDSTVYLTLVYTPPSNDTIFNTSCNLSDAGMQTLNMTNQFGCDSILTIITEYIAGDTIDITQMTCIQSDAGVFTESYLNSSGCDSTVMITVVFQNIIQEEVFVTTCDQSQVGEFTENLVTAIGCDSTVTTYVEYIAPDLIELQLTTCDSQVAGFFEDTYVNMFGCDSIVQSTIELLDSDYISISETSCDQNQVGTTVQMLTNQNGCDSIVETITTFSDSDFTLFTQESCDPSEVGATTETFINEAGCDSIVQVDILLIDSYSISITEETCDPSEEGIFTVMLISEFGCDSLVQTEVILLASDFIQLELESCDPADEGIFTEMLINENGCDSIVEVEVVLLDSDFIQLELESCDPADVGLFTEMLVNENGCDSIIETEVLLLDSDFIEIFEDICGEGEDEIITQMLLNQVGCDSIVSTITSYIALDTTYLFSETCDSLDAGLFVGTYLNQYGCDSTVISDVTVISDLSVSVQISQPDCFEQDLGAIQLVVNGGVQPYEFSINNSSLTTDPLFENLQAGSYEILVQDAEGCMIFETIQINDIDPVEVNLGDDQFISLGESAFLEAVINISEDSIASIQWISADSLTCDTCLTQNVFPLQTTTYAIEVVDEIGCIDRDEMLVSVSLIKDIYVPTVFSSSEISPNDFLMIYSEEGVVKNIEAFHGYDRWGNLVWEFNDFMPNDESFKWNGKYKGQDVNPGVFVWVAEIEFVTGEFLTLSGSVTVVD